jgi:hypothetical protein
MFTIFFIIWLIGFFPAYFFLCRLMLNYVFIGEHWENNDRFFCSLISFISSWILVFIVLFVWMIRFIFKKTNLNITKISDLLKFMEPKE